MTCTCYSLSLLLRVRPPLPLLRVRLLQLRVRPPLLRARRRPLRRLRKKLRLQSREEGEPLLAGGPAQSSPTVILSCLSCVPSCNKSVYCHQQPVAAGYIQRIVWKTKAEADLRG